MKKQYNMPVVCTTTIATVSVLCASGGAGSKSISFVTTPGAGDGLSAD